jgi:hypothetical protein
MEKGLAAVRAAATASTSAAAIEAASRVESAPARVVIEQPGRPEPAGTSNDLIAVARAESKAEGMKEGASAERARVKAIVTAPEARGRDALAHSLAFDTDLVPEAAVNVMKAAPEAKASRLDGMVPSPKVDAVESTGTASTAEAGLAAAVSRMVAKLPGHAAIKH